MAWQLLDDAPTDLPAPAVRRWEALHAQAADLYGQQYAAHVATKLVYDLWSSHTGRPRPRPTPGQLPQRRLGLVGLGHTIEIAGVEWGGSKIVSAKKLRLPICFWSHELQAVLSFPGLKVAPPVMSAYEVPKLLSLYRTWHDGKDPKIGASRGTVPRASFDRVLAGAIIAYSSDKFEPNGKYVTYVHHFELGRRGEPGPLIYVAKDAIMVRGGKLRLTADGLAG